MNKVLVIVGVLLVVAGVLGVAGASTADYTGLNLTQPSASRDEAAFGWVQGVSCGIGAVLALAGGLVAFFTVQRARKEAEIEFLEEEEAHEEQERKIEAYKAAKEKEAKNAQALQQREQILQDTPARTDALGSQGKDTTVVQETVTEASEDPLDKLGHELDIDTSSQLECPDCGEELTEGAKVCTVCGAVFEEEAKEEGE